MMTKSLFRALHIITVTSLLTIAVGAQTSTQSPTVEGFWQGALEAQIAAAKAQADVLLSPWFRFFLSYDPRPTLAKVKVPVLAMNGEVDVQVPAKADLAAIDLALKEAGNRDYKIVLLPKLNHLFQTSTTGAPSEYGSIEETIAPIALQTMGDWIVAHTSAAPRQ